MTRQDVVVIGGGAAGLNAALVLARARRSVIVVDGGEPRNAPAHGVHGFLGMEGIAPTTLLANGRQQVREYGGEIRSGHVVAVRRDGVGFAVELADGAVLRAWQVIVATGLVDELPPIEGLGEHWGERVLHCPYCHGWEVRDRAIAVLATGPMAVHHALLWRQWSDDVRYFTHTAPELNVTDREKLTARGIDIVDAAVAGVDALGDGLQLRLDDTTVTTCEVIALGTTLRVRADFLAPLGLSPTPHPSGAGDQITVDALGQTSVRGLWAAGNVSDPFAQVGPCAAAGARTAMAVNGALLTRDVERAVEHRDAARTEAAVHEIVTGHRRHGLVTSKETR